MVNSIIIALSALVVSGAVTYFLWNRLLAKKREKLVREAEAEAEVIKKEKILQAKEKFLQLKTEHEVAFNERNNKLLQAENKMKQREAVLSQKHEELQRKQNEVEAIRENLNNQLSLLDSASMSWNASGKPMWKSWKPCRACRPKRPNRSLWSRLRRRPKPKRCHISTRLLPRPK